MAIDPNLSEMILDHGIDLKNRRIYFGALPEAYDGEGSDFTWRSVERAIRAIHMMEMDGPNKPIELHMSSPGGDAYEMLRLIDVIEHSPCQIKFYGSGKIMSAATWIMAVCDERYLYRNARVLLHDGPVGSTQDYPGKEIDQRIEASENERLQVALNKIFADNSRMPESFYEIIVKRDTYLSAEETVMLGLADKVLEPKKRGNLRRMRIALLNKEVDKAELGKLIKSIYSRINESRLPSKIEIHSAHDRSDSKVFVEKDEPQKEKPAEQSAQPVVVEQASDQTEKSEP
jgi:ATP-dependent Clp protease protease subunit